jgi:hypothetical protein
MIEIISRFWTRLVTRVSLHIKHRNIGFWRV